MSHLTGCTLFAKVSGLVCQAERVNILQRIASRQQNEYAYSSRCFFSWKILTFLFFHENNCCGYSVQVLTEALLLSKHNIRFYGEIRKMLCEYPLLSGAMMLNVQNFNTVFHNFVATYCFSCAFHKKLGEMANKVDPNQIALQSNLICAYVRKVAVWNVMAITVFTIYIQTDRPEQTV